MGCHRMTSAVPELWSNSVSVGLRVGLSHVPSASKAQDAYRVVIQVATIPEEETMQEASVGLYEDCTMRDVNPEEHSLVFSVRKRKLLTRSSVGTVRLNLRSMPYRPGELQSIELPLVTRGRSSSLTSMPSALSSAKCTKLLLHVRFIELCQGDILGYLPDEISLRIGHMLNFNSLLSSMIVSRRWHSLLLDESIWHEHYRKRFPTAAVVGSEYVTWRDRVLHAHGCSLVTALWHANDGDTVILQPGIYKRPVMVRHRIHLLGDHDKDSSSRVVMDAGTNRYCITWLADGGSMEDLQITFRSGNNGIVVSERRTELTITNCSLRAEVQSCKKGSSATIEVTEKASIHMTGCTLDSGAAGVVMRRSAKGLIQDNVISGMDTAGMYVLTNASPTIRNNRIADCKDFGVLYNEGNGVLDGNSITGNGKCGVRVQKAHLVIIRHNYIHKNARQGVVLYRGTTADILENDISYNGSAGISLMDHAVATIHGNRIHHQSLLLDGESEATVSHCDVYANTLAGIEVRHGARCLMTNCSVRDGKRVAVYVHSKGSAILRHNEIHGHSHSNVKVHEAGTPLVLEANVIRDSQSNGIFLSRVYEAVIRHNEISQNGRGIYVSGDCGATIITRNVIRGSRKAGIIVSDRGSSTISHNVIEDNVYANLIVLDGSHPRLLSNVLRGGTKHCIMVQGSGGLFVRNDISYTRNFAFSLSFSRCIFIGNRMHRSAQQPDSDMASPRPNRVMRIGYTGSSDDDFDSTMELYCIAPAKVRVTTKVPSCRDFLDHMLTSMIVVGHK